MIDDRTPDTDTARAAAAAILLDDDPAPALPSTEPSASTHDSSHASGVLAMQRARFIDTGAIVVLGLSLKAGERWGAHWVFSEQECKALCEAVLDVAELYLPDVNSPWARLAIVLGATIVPRVLGEKQPPLEVNVETPAPSSPAPETAEIPEAW